MLKGDRIEYDGGGEAEIVGAQEIVIPGGTMLKLSAENRWLLNPRQERLEGLQPRSRVEHRTELVREPNGIRFYNDSIASSPTRTIADLSFNEKVILIAGGYDKNIPYDAMGKILTEKVKGLV